MSVKEVMKKIVNDGNLSERFCSLKDMGEIKAFVKEIDSGICDEEIEEFVNDSVYQFSELEVSELNSVSGGAMNKNFYHFRLPYCLRYL